jgi:hypothetical protein
MFMKVFLMFLFVCSSSADVFHLGSSLPCIALLCICWFVGM